MKIGKIQRKWRSEFELLFSNTETEIARSLDGLKAGLSLKNNTGSKFFQYRN